MDKLKEKTINPALILGIGLFPLVVVCTDLKSALTFGLILFVVMLFSQILVGAFRLVIADRVRFVCYTLAILAVVYAVDSGISELMQKAYDSLHHLIVYLFASSIVFFSLEKTKTKSFGAGLKDATILGAWYGLTMIVVGLIREILGSGSIWGAQIFGDFTGASFFSSLAGGLLVVLVVALIYNTITNLIEKRKRIYKSLVDRYTAVLDKNVQMEKILIPTKSELDEEAETSTETLEEVE